ncbi:Pr6Pr family membrane protein [Kribbella sp. NPDC051137]|uniref:Pr6Pr family membrane protein n=1 Tax=Kribbella sp. NPDC051137 TaxID=3155045 RepID=UPI0034143560
MSRLSRWVQAGIAAVILVSLVIQLVLILTGGEDANSGDSGTAVGLGTRLWRLFSFFTIQSNLIVLAAAVALVLRPLRDGALWPVVRLDSLLGIVITGLVFAIVLAPQVHLTGWALAATIGFHYISPWTTLAAWLVYIFTQGAFTHWYPYQFLDVNDVGLATALRNAAFVLVLGLLLAAGLKALDTKLPARS